jgi:hypothetical protein
VQAHQAVLSGRLDIEVAGSSPRDHGGNGLTESAITAPSGCTGAKRFKTAVSSS